MRTFRLPLQGDMARYVWMIDGQVWPKADPLRIRRGERVQVELVNETMMWHPMHLHGHFFRLLQGAGDCCPLKHTVNVAPRQTVQHRVHRRQSRQLVLPLPQHLPPRSRHGARVRVRDVVATGLRASSHRPPWVGRAQRAGAACGGAAGETPASTAEYGLAFADRRGPV